MLTTKTCPTSDLERLCLQYGTPTTLEESAILAGAKHELANRNEETIQNRKSPDNLPGAGYYESCRALKHEAAQLRA